MTTNSNPEKKRFSIDSSGLANLLLANLKSNATDMSKMAEHFASRLNHDKTAKAIKLIKIVQHELEEMKNFKNKEEISSGNLRPEKSIDTLNEVIEILISDEDYYDYSQEVISEEEGSEDITDTLNLVKSYSHNYFQEIKYNNLLKIKDSTSKFTKSGHFMKDKDSTLEKIEEEQHEFEEGNKKVDENKKVNFEMVKKFNDAVKIKEKLNKIFCFDFNIFDLEEVLNDKLLPVVASHVLKSKNFFENNYIDEQKFYSFAEDIAAGYNRKNVVYHNDIHATDVFQTVFNIFHYSEIDEVKLYLIFNF